MTVWIRQRRGTVLPWLLLTLLATVLALTSPAAAVGNEGSVGSPAAASSYNYDGARQLSAPARGTLAAVVLTAETGRTSAPAARGQLIGSGEDQIQVGRYFTPDNITTARAATEQLALPGTEDDPLVGYFDTPSSSLPSEPFATFGPRLVNPEFGQPGGGFEMEVSELFGRPSVPTSGISLVGF